jgi:Rieske Fe-S protein
VAVSRGEDGRFHAVSAVCTHLGCLVAWNGAEKSWDCPCHGSRFGVAGEVLEGPAVRPLESRDL